MPIESPRATAESFHLEEGPLERGGDMNTLETFLAQRAEIKRGRADHETALQKEWNAAVERLLDQMTNWLRTADKERLLEIERTHHRLREMEVGVYDAPGLIVRLDAREVRVVPIARMVVGPDLSNGIIRIVRSFGRVDMTDGARKYLVFRTRIDPAEEWTIVEDEGFTFKKFTRESFEEAMQSLLQ
jgi:hypothetical protein